MMRTGTTANRILSLMRKPKSFMEWKGRKADTCGRGMGAEGAGSNKPNKFPYTFPTKWLNQSYKKSTEFQSKIVPEQDYFVLLIPNVSC